MRLRTTAGPRVLCWKKAGLGNGGSSVVTGNKFRGFRGIAAAVTVVVEVNRLAS